MARVLVIDDDAQIRALVVKFLEKAGHTASAASSAELGLAALRRRETDITLLDLEMPETSGLACLAAIRGDPALARTPVFMVTATPLREVVIRVARLGVQGIVIKSDNWIPRLVAQVDKFAASDPTIALPDAPTPSPPPAGTRSAAPAIASPGAAPRTASAAAIGAVEGWLPPDIHPSHGPMTDERAMETLRSLKPIIARSELLDAMLAETVSVRALRPAAQQVLALTGRAESSMPAVVNAIRQDQALSLRILRMANSTLYARGDRVDNVAKAVARIGLAQIRSAVLSVSVLDAFGSFSGSDAFRADWFWEHSTATGTLAMRLSQARGHTRDHCETMFTAGLLHDLGRLLYAEHLPEHYPKVIQTAERLELPLETVETRLLLVNHADITDRLLRHWKFAPTIIAPVAFHHLSLGNIKSTAPRAADDVVPLALANRLAHATLAGSSGNEVLYPIEDFVDHLRLDAGKVATLLAGASAELADLRVNMLMHSGEPGRGYIDTVRERLGDARPLTLALRPEIDPVSIMASALRGGAPCQDPNLVTLRIRSPHERVAAKRLLDEAAATSGDGGTGGGPLPVLVVGDGRSCLLQDGLLGDRTVRQVTLPRSVGRLLRDMRELAGVEHAHV